MAKQDHAFPIKGRIGNLIFTNGAKHGASVRRAPKPSRKKRSAEFRFNSHQTPTLNDLAAEIHKTIYKDYPFRSSGFYHAILSRFREVKSDNRFLLLHSLKGMEINPEYKFKELGQCNTVITQERNKIQVTLKTGKHPTPPKPTLNEYCYSMVLLTWGAAPFKSEYQQQLTDWIDIPGRHKTFDIEFTVPKGTIHWVLFLHQALSWGAEDFSLINKEYQGMIILDVGSLIKKDDQLLMARQNKPAEQENKVVESKKKVKAREE
jgi:hypothetical protein